MLKTVVVAIWLFDRH